MVNLRQEQSIKKKEEEKNEYLGPQKMSRVSRDFDNKCLVRVDYSFD